VQYGFGNHPQDFTASSSYVYPQTKLRICINAQNKTTEVEKHLFKSGRRILYFYAQSFRNPLLLMLRKLQENKTG